MLRSLRVSVLLLLTATHWFCASTKTTPEQIFRDTTQWNNPASMSQTVHATAHAGNTLNRVSSAFALTTSQATGAAFGSTTVNGYGYDEKTANVIASNVLRFAHDIGRQLAENAHHTKSEVFSPLSVMSALSLLLLGAKGKSYQELSQVLGLNGDLELRSRPSRFHEEFASMVEDLQGNGYGGTSSQRRWNTTPWRNTVAGANVRVSPPSAYTDQYEHVIKVANGVFTQSGGYTLNPNYRLVVQSAYRAELKQLDFDNSPAAAREYINAWVNSNTNGKIPNILNDNVPHGTNVVLASALYFKGLWENSFIEAATIIDDFYPEGAQRRGIKVRMMATGGIFPFYDAREYDCRIIGLPYKGNVTTMYVIQPNQSSRDKLKHFQSTLSAQKIEDMIAKMSQKTAVLAFPKMHFVRSINMKNLLNRLGIYDIFINGASDLSLIGGQGRYFANGAAPPAVAATAAVAAAPVQQLQFTRQNPASNNQQDRYSQQPLVFSRSGLIEEDNTTSGNVEEEKNTESAKSKRDVRLPATANALNLLDAERFGNRAVPRSDLFVEDILHKVDFNVNEQGTEAAAATVTYLKRSGTDVLFRADTPFLVLIRHDPTKLVLFYGIINEPIL